MEEVPKTEPATTTFDKLTQVLLPALTILGTVFISLKHPEIGLPINALAQIFWIYAAYVSWKKAGQFGIFITAVIMTGVIFYGVINYWFL